MVITDIPESSTSGTNTPLGESVDNDFFSSWDKPSIIKPSNPPSRTATPPTNNNGNTKNEKTGSRSASPFLNAPANGNFATRPKSPLANAGGSDSSTAAVPAASRTTSSSAIRKAGTGGAGGARKTNILGGGKKSKLGAKKVTTGEDVDFEAAEKAAKEEAERIEKLGYDPSADDAGNATETSAAANNNTSGPEIVSPTPISPARGGFGATSKGHDRNPADMERLGMGIGKLGFGQVGSNKAKSAGGAKKLGFGATGGNRAATQDGIDGLSFFSTCFPILSAQSNQHFNINHFRNHASPPSMPINYRR